jgi:RHS repeat-associated protein
VPTLESEAAPAGKAPDGTESGVSWSASQPRPAPAAADDTTPIEEAVELRDATSRVFRHSDGSLTVDAYATPINYPTSDGWAPIDNTVAADESRAGWVRTAGNEWTVGFGSARQGVELSTSAGVVSMTPIASAKGQPAAVAPRVTSKHAQGSKSSPSDGKELMSQNAVADAGVVEYPGVWPGVTLRYEVRGSGLKEEIVVSGPDRGSEFVFDLAGTTVALGDDGGLTLSGTLGELFTIPPPTIAAADGSDVTQESGVRYEIRQPEPSHGSDSAGARVAVVLDADWLAKQPAQSFPLVIDPSFSFLAATSAVSYSSLGGSSSVMPISLGRSSGTGAVWRGAVRFNQYEPYITGGYRIYSSWLNFYRQDTNAGSTQIELYEQGAQPTSYAQIGNGKPLIGTITDPTPPDPALPQMWTYNEMDRWLTQGLTNQWFGVRGTESGNTLRNYDVRLTFQVYQPPQPSYVNNIADQQVLSSTTPLLQAQLVPLAPDGTLPYDEFQITTSPAPGSGLVVSGFDQQHSASSPATWQVPPGTLQEGVTYWAWVLTDWTTAQGSVPPVTPPLANGRKFTVDLGVGDGGPSPTDQVGSVPGKATSPAEGAPSPALPGSKVTANLVNGNVSLTMGTTTMGTLSGGLALGFTHNSLTTGSQGLRAEFFNDTNSSGAIDAGDVAVGERIDPTVSFDWGVWGRAVVAHDPTRALGRWTGLLTVPSTGTWQVGAISSDGLRATVDGTLRLDRWTSHEPESAPVFGSSFTATAGSPVPLSVEWRNTTSTAVARVFLKDVTTNLIYPLSPAWVTRSPRVLPDGWTFSAAAGTARWVGLQDRGTSVSAFAADGSAHEFVSATNGSYTPPITAPNDLLAVGDGGRFVLRDAGGSTYTFRSDGTLESLVSAGDDRTPAALVYGYSGTPVRLRTITDPVSNRTVTLSYGGDTACSSAPAAAAGLLCHIGFWDGTATTLTYDTSGRFIRLTNPGAIVHDFAYDSSGRLTDVRDPLANDAIAAGVRADDTNARTQITYYSDGKVNTIASPTPTAGALRPLRTYTYDTTNRTGSVSVAGFAPTVGFAQRSRYDTRNRITETTGSDGLNTTYAWDTLDRIVATTDAAGLRTTTLYDYASRPTTTYGPAPVASFQANGLPAAGMTVPTTARAYDGAISGLAAAYWTNPYLAGGPALHDTGLGTGGAMDRDWSSTPPVTPGAGGWSARYNGSLSVGSAGSYQFQINTKGSTVKVWVDDILVVDHNQAEPPTGWTTTTGAATSLTAGPHRFRVDMVDTTGPAGLQVLWKPPAGSFVIVPGSALNPNYGLLTSTTDPDSKVTATEYSDAASGIGPHYALTTATVADPAGLNLRTTTTYETPGAGSYLRRVARTLPAGNTTTTVNYAGTEGPTAAVCGVSSGTPQAGMPKRITGADPDGAGPGSARIEEFVYDTIGRQVGRRVATIATLSGAGWICTTYDARGRMATQSWPFHVTAPPRTTTYTYAVGGNPLINRVTDSTWGSSSITATVDLLGRTTSYTDIWGRTTTTVFDQAGRQTSSTGPLGTLTQNYSTTNGRSSTTVMNGTTIATPAYDGATGRTSSVGYGNGTYSIPSYDTYGRATDTLLSDNQGTSGETNVTRSLAGRLVDEKVFDGTGFIDAAAGQPNFIYDGAGRLTDAKLSGTTYTYGYGSAGACTLAPNAGTNTNRALLTITGAGAGTTSSCYNQADQLVSTSSIPATDIVYDDHGNTTRLGTDTYDFDAADRHVRTETPVNVTSYQRDPLDRIAQRTDRTRIVHIATTTAAASGASVNVTRPAGTQPGDLLLASVAAEQVPFTGNITSAGWNIAADQGNVLAHTVVFWRYATATDPGSWAFAAANALNTTAALSTYRNADASTPIAVSAKGSATNTTSHPIPQVTTPGDAQTLVHVSGFGASVASMSPPAGTTTRASVTSGASLLVLDRYQSYPGTSSAVSVTTGGNQNSANITVALAPVTTVARYGYPGHSDNSHYTTNIAGTVTAWAIGLPGNTTYMQSADGIGYSHANTHGDTVTVTDNAGNRVWTGITGPYGERVTTTDPGNTNAPGTSWRSLGQQQRLTDRNIIHMGARPYSVANGRFLAVDPIEGGCANNYTYVHGDPLQQQDVSGKGFFGDVWDAISCDPIASIGIAAGLVGLVFSGGTLGAVAAGIAFAAGAYSTVDACLQGDEVGCFAGLASLGFGGLGSALNRGSSRLLAMGGEAALFSNPLRAYALGANIWSVGFDVGAASQC